MEVTSIGNRLAEIFQSIGDLRPMMILIGGSILLLVLGLTKLTKLKELLFAAILIITLFSLELKNVSLFNDYLKIDGIAVFIQYVIIISTAFLLIFREDALKSNEYLFLTLSLLAGSILMTISKHLLVAYLSVELTSLSAYLLTAFKFKKESFEASIKYLLIGTVSSSLMIYGISLLYGLNGSLLIDNFQPSNPLGYFGLFLFLGGLLFKVSVFPFHIWAPSAYQNAPTRMVALFSIVPKLGGLVLIYHLFDHTNHVVLTLIITFSLISILIGSFAALSQQDPKRLLAYGAIAHSGFLLPLIIFKSNFAENSFLIYAAVYAVMNLGTFYMVHLHEKKDLQSIDSYAGLGKVFPFLGAGIVVLMIALVGLPPTGGFSIKLLLFSVIYEAYESTGQNILIVYLVVGVLMSAVSLFYYLKIPYQYFLKKTTKTSTAQIGLVNVMLATFFSLLVLSVFIWPEILDNFTSRFLGP